MEPSLVAGLWKKKKKIKEKKKGKTKGERGGGGGKRKEEKKDERERKVGEREGRGEASSPGSLASVVVGGATMRRRKRGIRGERMGGRLVNYFFSF